MRPALFGLLAVAVALAWAMSARRREHRPIALALSVQTAAACARAALISFHPPNPDPSAPLRTGAALLAAYADRALVLVWPAALAALSLRTLAGVRAWPVALAYLGAAAYAIGAYPVLRFAALRRFYLAVDLLVLAVGVASIVAWGRRAWRRQGPEVWHEVTAALIAAHIAGVLVTYGGPIFSPRGWEPMRAAYILILSAVVLLHGGALWRSKSTPL